MNNDYPWDSGIYIRNFNQLSLPPVSLHILVFMSLQTKKRALFSIANN